jgi:hypothetical protein
VVSQIFQLSAALEFVIVIGFELIVRIFRARGSPAHQAALERGQRKDNVLAWVVVGLLGIFTCDAPIQPALLLGGVMVLAWLAQRAVRRLRVLGADS